MSLKKILPLITISAVIFFAQFLIHFPDLLGLKNTPKNMWYSGQVSWFDPWDMNVYFSAINWGKRSSNLLFQNVYTTQNHPGAPIYTAYTALGKLSNLLKTSPQVMLHLAAVCLSTLFLIAVYKITDFATKKHKEKVIIFILIALGGGLGWILFPKIKVPDISTPGFTVFSSLRRPHEAISSTLYLSILYLTFLILQKGRKKLVPLTLGLFFIFCFFHFYMALLIGLVCLSLAFIRWQESKKINYFKLPVLLLLIGCFYAFLTWQTFIKNPAFSGLLKQQQKSDNPFLLILAFGLLTPFIIIALLTRKKDDRLQYLKLWFIWQFFLLYLPVGFKRLFIRNFFVPGALLAFKGIKNVVKEKVNFLCILIMIVFFSIFSSFYVFFKRIKETKSQNRWIYITQEEKKAIDYLENRAPAESGVLTSYLIGNFIPANTAKRVFLGHQFQTQDFQEKYQKMVSFYQGKMKEKEALSFLNTNNISYVFWGPEERKINNQKQFPYQLDCFFDNQKVKIFKIKHDTMLEK